MPTLTYTVTHETLGDAQRSDISASFYPEPRGDCKAPWLAQVNRGAFFISPSTVWDDKPQAAAGISARHKPALGSPRAFALTRMVR